MRSYNAYVVRYTAAGVQTWSRIIDSENSQTDYGMNVAATSTTIYLAAYTGGTFPNAVGNGAATVKALAMADGATGQ